ncbi:MiaB-like tRNA modifying enzyme YliG [Chloroherpeton thalassium ATCC 35110]|uniref:Ribosomal protein uS12 methylthiotransferase RimO n=1 Tax=Chloroherpeton thalassium (strain ATCC 35110 / GB-78) TaxID=517418 RepID=RIMO_CHLT3|nr:30S ribosomal protein S12 methylthiotransferase RimO [Chloroherpeton thalassium]B3QSS3.1 RecName: Full=Ribosomal protein uS12 methylthiotransferase RimO; Short=uS12 MTTase; Short=uS12 methylthiotransferase; AltName: Full=Ribosomal protein uS12 (aspartate-C(3))-methylthiotransferase; AltName: Full=Ribosome maturation factor RimO [Chloroherpeton thalassium ATCC 35110]ACF14120.1 MiaB-like tRNA modifying enzyme YliG [Chloroherpeton thalassium ATCC 35110]
METKRSKLYLLTLGCSKNMVDSEVLLAQAKANQIYLAEDFHEADTILINTCGFIDKSKQESIDQILEAIRFKEAKRIKKVIVFGCLSERYKDALREEIPEVDCYFGTRDLSQIIAELGGHYKTHLLGERELLTPPYFSYLKISEGCDHPCAFCAIPLMRGKQVSRPIDELLLEAKKLKEKGVRELCLIAQDTTYYGHDLNGKRQLAELLQRLSDLQFDWIRLLYAYPAMFPTDILPVMRERENICKYLDLPLQHVSDEMLKSMRRGISKRKTTELIAQIRSEVPGIRLRTTMLVGYPNETEEQFSELVEFVRETQFDRLGCFAYSHEEGTEAHELPDTLTEEEKERRVELLMAAQEEIAYAKNQALVGSFMPVLIERFEANFAIGRTEYDAPEVDNEVVIALDEAEQKKVKVGTFYQARITDAEAFDLFGSLVL